MGSVLLVIHLMTMNTLTEVINVMIMELGVTFVSLIIVTLDIILTHIQKNVLKINV